MGIKRCRGYPILNLKAHNTDITNFSKDCRGKDGLQPRCKSCQKIWNAKENPKNNPKTNSNPKYDNIRATCGKEAQRIRFTAQPEYVRTNPEIRKAHQNIRRKREDLNRIHGPKTWAVDHIIPIGKRVHKRDGICGLDVPWNMEIIPHCTNSRKSDHVDWRRIIRK